MNMYRSIGNVLLRTRIYGFTEIRQLIYFKKIAKELDKVLGGSSKNSVTILTQRDTINSANN